MVTLGVQNWNKIVENIKEFRELIIKKGQHC